jgi:hypothetical protein
MGLLLLIVLIVLLVGAFPTYPYSRRWGYQPVGIVSFFLLLLLVLLFMEVLPWGWTWGPATPVGP